MPTEDQRYFIRLRGKTRGPFTVTQLRQLHARGQFSKLHQVSVDGTSWSPATEFIAQFSGKPLATNPLAIPTQALPASAEDSVDWYYVLDDQRLGPVKEQDLKAQLRLGNIPPEALLWHPGLADWVEAAELFPNATHPRRTSPLTTVSLVLLVGLAVAGAGGLGWWLTQSSNTAGLASLLRPAGEIHSLDLTQQEVHEQIRSAIGMVVCYAEIYRKTGERHEFGFGHGSCFVVTRDGYAITNQHVVQNYQEWTDASSDGRITKLIQLRQLSEQTESAVIPANARADYNQFVKEVTPELIETITPRLAIYFGEKSYSAQVVFISRKFDMAILKIEGWPPSAYFALSQQSETPRGTTVVALGFPGVSQQAVTADENALLASKSRSKNVAELLWGQDDHRKSFKSSAFEFVQTPGEISVVQKEAGDIYHIQHTAAIRPGNSGGPLVNRNGPEAGTVLGINTLYLVDESPVFISFPVAQMRDELEATIGLRKLTWR